MSKAKDLNDSKNSKILLYVTGLMKENKVHNKKNPFFQDEMKTIHKKTGTLLILKVEKLRKYSLQCFFDSQLNKRIAKEMIAN